MVTLKKLDENALGNVKNHPEFKPLMEDEVKLGVFSIRDRPSMPFIKWLWRALVYCRFLRPATYHTVIVTNKRVTTIMLEKFSETIFTTEEQDTFLQGIRGFHTYLKSTEYPICYGISETLEPFVILHKALPFLLCLLSILLTIAWAGIPLVFDLMNAFIVAALLVIAAICLLILKAKSTRGDYSLHIEIPRTVIFFVSGIAYIVLSLFYCIFPIVILAELNNGTSEYEDLRGMVFGVNTTKQLLSIILLAYIAYMYPQFGTSEMIRVRIIYEGELDYGYEGSKQQHIMQLSAPVAQEVRAMILELKRDVMDMKKKGGSFPVTSDAPFNDAHNFHDRVPVQEVQAVQAMRSTDVKYDEPVYADNGNYNNVELNIVQPDALHNN